MIMIRTLKITSIAVGFLAICSLGLSVAFGLRPDPEMAEFLETAGAIEKFKAAAAQHPEDQSRLSPLVKQAQAFALLINPPEPPTPERPSRPTTAVKPTIPKPSVVRSKFDLIGICYYRSHPDRSLALIDEPGKGIHWVKQAGKVGHLIIEQIRKTSLIYRDGQRTPQELFVPKRTAKKSLLKSAASTVGTEKTPSTGSERDRRPVSRISREDEERLRLARRSDELSRSPRVPPKPTKEQAQENIDWLKEIMTDPESLGISAEEAKNLGDLGKIIKELEQETDRNEAEDVRPSSVEATENKPEPNVPGP